MCPAQISWIVFTSMLRVNWKVVFELDLLQHQNLTTALLNSFRVNWKAVFELGLLFHIENLTTALLNFLRMIWRAVFELDLLLQHQILTSILLNSFVINWNGDCEPSFLIQEAQTIPHVGMRCPASSCKYDGRVSTNIWPYSIHCLIQQDEAQMTQGN